MSKINLSKATIEALNDLLDESVLENNIDLMEDCIDEFLSDIPTGDEESRQVLDRVASLRNVSKQFSTILKTLK